VYLRGVEFARQFFEFECGGRSAAVLEVLFYRQSRYMRRIGAKNGQDWKWVVNFCIDLIEQVESKNKKLINKATVIGKIFASLVVVDMATTLADTADGGNGTSQSGAGRSNELAKFKKKVAKELDLGTSAAIKGILISKKA
jgi:hypothetical protein